jgi:hypothetical protein
MISGLLGATSSPAPGYEATNRKGHTPGKQGELHSIKIHQRRFPLRIAIFQRAFRPRREGRTTFVVSTTVACPSARFKLAASTESAQVENAGKFARAGLRYGGWSLHSAARVVN